jgi:hypothetical protein
VLEGENKQTGIVLRAGNAPIARIPDTAAMASSAVTLDLESRLRAVAPLEAAQGRSSAHPQPHRQYGEL